MIGPPVQVAYGVADVRAAAHRWTARGAGPFFVLDHIDVTNVRLHGSPDVFDHSSAYGWWGELMIELICQHDPGDEPFVPPQGLHHVAHFVTDLAEAQSWLTARGHPESLFAETSPGSAFAMHDARHDLGHHVEIYAASDRLLGFYDMVREASEAWSAEAPIRDLR